METKEMVLAVVSGEVVLLKELVSAEIARLCQEIDGIIQRVYDVVPAKHTEKAIAEVKAAILDLVRSPLADLERKLEELVVKPEEEPKLEPEVELETPTERELETGERRVKVKV